MDPAAPETHEIQASHPEEKAMVATPEDYDFLTVMWVPLTPDDIPDLESLLRVEDPFVASTIDTDDPYRLVNYIQHSIHGKLELAAILDRNLISRVARLATGSHVEHSDPQSKTYRVAAACMAFLITANVMIEPNISLYELAESAADCDSQDDLRSFRIADHLHPQSYLEVALGRAPGIHPDLISEAHDRANGRDRLTASFKAPLRHWRRHRCALAQIALLERGPLDGREKFERFIEWSMSPGFFDGSRLRLP